MTLALNRGQQGIVPFLWFKDGLHNFCGRAASIFGWWARGATTPNAKNARSPDSVIDGVMAV